MHTITFATDGTACTLWTEALPLHELGRLFVRRASWIDFNEHTQKWEVRFTPHADDAVFTNASRSECITWEHKHLNK